VTHEKQTKKKRKWGRKEDDKEVKQLLANLDNG